MNGRGRNAKGKRRRDAGAKVTLRDVARATRLSLTTISRALRDELGIAEATRTRVKNAALRLGYVPNAAGAALSTGRMRSVVYVLSETSPVVPGLLQMEVLRGLIDELAVHGYTVTVISEASLRRLGLTIFDVHRAQHADGVVLALEHAEEIAPGGSRHSLPMVIVNRVLDQVRADFVLADDEKGGFAATMHLVGLGHTAIGHITSDQDNFGLLLRRRGYEAALREAGLKLSDDLVSRAGLISGEGGYLAARRLIDAKTTFTALFCASDVLVPGVLRALRESGLRVPDDVAIVSFDDHLFAEMIHPPLTTIRKPRYEMGLEAGRLLMRRLSGEAAAPPATVLLETRLIERHSSGLPRVTAPPEANG